MPKIKQKLTAIQRKVKQESKAERQLKFQWVFIAGKQVRIKRAATIDGITQDEFILRNADSVWLHQNGMYAELLACECGSDDNFI